MASLSRASVALVLSTAFVLAVACGSSNKKKAPYTPGDGGEAGATEPTAGRPAGGSSGRVEPGAAGEAGSSEGGAAGATASEAGAGGAVGPGEAGSSGAGGSGGGSELACLPSGSVEGLDVDPEAIHQLCRGGLAWLPFTTPATADVQFNCCAVSNAAYDFPMAGFYNGDNAGNLSFLVPADAPKAAQSITITCSAGELAHTASVELTDTAPPVVTATTPQITSQGALKVTGSNLAGVTGVWATPLQLNVNGEATSRFCTITATSQSDTNIDCTFGYIDPGQYIVNVFAGECGAIADAKLTVLPPPT